METKRCEDCVYCPDCAQIARCRAHAVPNPMLARLMLEALVKKWRASPYHMCEPRCADELEAALAESALTVIDIDALEGELPVGHYAPYDHFSDGAKAVCKRLGIPYTGGAD